MLPNEGLKRKRSAHVELLGQENDMNYVDEESELSSGDLSSSDPDVLPESVHIAKKRGRAKSEKSGESPNVYSAPVSSRGCVSDVDETGEEKIDTFGRLLGGREYKVPVFTVPTRGETLFMFSKDPAAILGYRDSFVFLKRNPNLVKIHLNNAERGYLVDARQLRSTFRTRDISVVTARSVFKRFGNRVIKKGRKGRDDYYYTEEIEQVKRDPRKKEEMTVSPATNITTTAPNVATQPPILISGKNALKYDAFIPVNNAVNWMHSAAVATRQFNNTLFSYRRSNPTNYDLLTNVYQISNNKQIVNESQHSIKKEIDNVFEDSFIY